MNPIVPTPYLLAAMEEHARLEDARGADTSLLILAGMFASTAIALLIAAFCPF